MINSNFIFVMLFLIVCTLIYEVYRMTQTNLNLQKQVNKYKYNCLHDSLTGLANKQLFYDRLQHILHNREPGLYQVAIIDLDGFKKVNDTKGHSIGDELLKKVAQRLKQAVRIGDTVARIGGDEFAIITTAPIRDIIKKRIAASMFGIKYSIGFSYILPGDIIRTVIDRADKQMYEDKAS